MFTRIASFFTGLVIILGLELKAQETSPSAETSVDASVLRQMNLDGKKTSPIGKGLYELAGGAAGSFVGIFTSLTFHPTAYYIPFEPGLPPFLEDADPLKTISPFWPAYIVSPIGSALGVYYCGKYMGDNGSLVGSLVGAGAGEAIWWLACRQARRMFPSDVAVNQVTYHARPVIVAAVALAGYKLVPQIKIRTKTLGFELRPKTDEHGAGAEVDLRF